MDILVISLVFLSSFTFCDIKITKDVDPYKKADNYIKLSKASHDLIFKSLEKSDGKRPNSKSMSHLANSIYFSVQAMQHGKPLAPSFLIDTKNNSDLLHLLKQREMRKELYKATRIKTDKRYTLSSKNYGDLANLLRYNGKATQILEDLSNSRDAEKLHSNTKRYIKIFNKMLSVYNPDLMNYKKTLLTDIYNEFQNQKIMLSSSKITQELKSLELHYKQELKIHSENLNEIQKINKKLQNAIKDMMTGNAEENRKSGYKNFYEGFHSIMTLPHSCDEYSIALAENAFRILNAKMKAKEVELPKHVVDNILFLGHKFENRLKN